MQEELMNRYLHAVLTIIALELGWIALNHHGTAVSAQPQPTEVVLTGIQLGRNQTLPVALRVVDLDPGGFVPVGVLGQTGDRARFQPIDVRAAQPVQIETTRPIEVRIPVTSSPVPGQ
jgi:hypothetical protein